MLQVVNSAQLTCTMGMAPSMLVVLPKNRMLSSYQPAANIMDHIPLLNILPFGLCRSPGNPTVAAATAAALGVLTPMPCVPNTPSPWLPGVPSVLLGGQPVLDNSCMLMCAWLGVIQVAQPGQTTHMVGAMAGGGAGGAGAFAPRAISVVTRFRWGLPPWEQRIVYGDSLEIRPDPNDPTFQSRALAMLVRLDSTRTMHSAFDAIEASGHRVTLENYHAESDEDTYNAFCTSHNVNDALTPGRGSDSTVTWNPDVQGFGPPGTTPDWQQPGADVIAGHELIHATHNATGNHGDNWQNDQVAVNEERNTVGLPPQTYNHPADGTGYNGTALPDTTGQAYTENGLRQEYSDRGMVSPATGRPPEQRPSYYTDTPPVF